MRCHEMKAPFQCADILRAIDKKLAALGKKIAVLSRAQEQVTEEVELDEELTEYDAKSLVSNAGHRHKLNAVRSDFRELERWGRFIRAIKDPSVELDFDSASFFGVLDD